MSKCIPPGNSDAPGDRAGHLGSQDGQVPQGGRRRWGREGLQSRLRLRGTGILAWCPPIRPETWGARHPLSRGGSVPGPRCAGLGREPGRGAGRGPGLAARPRPAAPHWLRQRRRRRRWLREPGRLRPRLRDSGRCGPAPPGPECAEDGNTPPAMSLGRLLRRASSKASDLLTLTPAGSGPLSVLDGEIIYSKNNVCVHPPEGLQGLGEHHPGYLCLYMEKDELLGATLILAWVPNSRIQRQDEEALRYITPESSPVRKAPRPRGRRAQSSGAPHQPSTPEPRPTLIPRDEDILVVAQSIRDTTHISPSPDDGEKLAQGLGMDGPLAASQPAHSDSGILSAVSLQDGTEEGRELRPEAGEEEGSLELSADGVSRDSSFDSDSDAFSSPFCLSPISAALAESSGSVFLESESG
ncbi:TBC1 domain family member 16-like [Diceros bicornis minor]|uniref:TBC1 domain family member 16-like n=1 Tax=Diceros bicornis minor TaxID=77932 RepID=UPI0026EA27A7|nr:TBC1 domain family member 16-like [Diceros bicornis minor]